jgi:hypothetical protein
MLYSQWTSTVLHTLRSRLPNLEVYAYADGDNIYTTVNCAASIINAFSLLD